MSTESTTNSLASRPLVTAQFPWTEAAERAIGFLLLAAAAPLLLLAGATLAALSRRSPFIAHLRVGHNQAPFWVLKLRTMWTPGPAFPGERDWIERIVAEPDEDDKDPCDGRVSSRFAAFCRRHSIDELPQLWHVFRGDMSLVGPRPLTRSEVARYYGVHAVELLSRKPGLTGLWQVSGRSAIRFPERTALDLKLVRTLTPSVYLKLLFRTIPALIYGRGAW